MSITETGSTDDAVEFDPFSETFFNDPYDVYARLREEAPVYYNEKYGFWALSRWHDVLEASRDWRTFSSANGIDLHALTTGIRPAFDSLIMMDPPKHDRLRALVSRVFTPRAMTALEPMIREVINGYFDALGDRKEFDLVQDVAGPFPVDVIARMLGVPAEDAQQVRHWIDAILTKEEGSPDYGDAASKAAIALGGYFFNLAREKRANPTDDMISGLVAAEVEGDDGQMTQLDDVEIAGFSLLLGGAGAETVTKLVANAAVLFARNPGEWQKVLDDPDTLPGAFEEVLRYFPPSQYQGRYVTRDVTLHGVTIPANSPCILLTGAAVRDPDGFEDPNRFDISRPPALSIGFGYGIHSCLGAALARVEGRIAIEELAKRYPKYRIDESGLKRVKMANVAGFSSVPVIID